MSAQHRMAVARRPFDRRLLGAIVLVSALSFSAVLPARISNTDAAWVDSEYAGASMAALSVPAPTLGATCTLVPGVAGLNPVITFTWTIPAGSGLTLSNISYGISGVSGLEVVTGGLLASVVTTGPVAGVYTTKFNSGLLGGLLGGTKTAAVRFTLPGTTWVSPWASVQAQMALAGLNPSCTVL